MNRLFYAERCAALMLSERGVPLIKAEARYPEFVAYENLSSIRAINAEYARRARMAVRAFVTDQRAFAEEAYRLRGGEDFAPFEFLQVFCISLLSMCVVSLYFDAYRYTGGAHGGTVRASDTFLARTGERLPLGAFFSPGADYRSRILANVESEIDCREAEAPGSFFENSKELAHQAFHPANYYLSDDHLTVYYQQYDIAPYSTGIPAFCMEAQEADAKINFLC